MQRIRESSAKYEASLTKMWELEASVLQRDIEANGKEATIEKIQRDSIENYKDPDSVLFRDLKLVEFGDGVLLCGSLNAKNGFGAYVGYQQFLASTIKMYLPRKGEAYAMNTAVMINKVCM